MRLTRHFLDRVHVTAATGSPRDPERAAARLFPAGKPHRRSRIVGLPGALAVGRLMRGVLYGVQPHDVVTVAALCIAVVVTTLLAATVPAVRAGRVDPVTVLRA